jgi:hypothetical protein
MLDYDQHCNQGEATLDEQDHKDHKDQAGPALYTCFPCQNSLAWEPGLNQGYGVGQTIPMRTRDGIVESLPLVATLRSKVGEAAHLLFRGGI